MISAISKLVSVLTILFSLLGTAYAQQNIGGYNVYYGSLHNHTNVSDDAIQTPLQAYTYAKEVANLDFFGLSDHAHAITDEEWKITQNNADQITENGKFVAFRGFEWSHGNYGHVTVVNASELTNRNETEKFSDLVRWLEGNDAIAFLNHPGRQNGGGHEFHNFKSTPSENIVGIELWNQSRPFTRYYYTNGYDDTDGGLGFFEEAQINGWKIGASGSGDNHGATWGTRNSHRMAILAKELTRESLYQAMKERRFFTTIDKNIGLSFKINGAQMGSIIPTGSHQAVIEITDGDNEIFTKVKLFKNGKLLTSWNPNTVSPILNYKISNSKNGDFYHVKISQQDGDEAISSPIYISSLITNGVKITTKSKIANINDDAEEDKNGKVRTTSPDLELVYDGDERGDQTIGLRFTNLNIPPGALITNAYLQFTANGNSKTYSLITIKGEDTDNSLPFSDLQQNISNRNTTESNITWGPFKNTWNESENGINQKTSNIKSIIQEIVNRNGYATNNAITLIITGIGEKRAYSFDGNQDKSAELIVEYTTPTNNQDPTISITNINNNQNFILGNEILIEAEANDTDGTISTVSFYNGTTLLGKDMSAPYSFILSNAAIGKHNITVKATDNNNKTTTSNSVNIYINEGNQATYAVTSRIEKGSDDVEEDSNNNSVVTDRLMLDLSEQIVGLRFKNLNIPKGAQIKTAYVQFWVSKTASNPVTVTIYGEKSDDSPTFISENGNVTSRAKTSEMVNWNVPNWERWSNGGKNQQTDDLSLIIQEIVDRDNYTEDSSITLLFEGNNVNSRIAVSHEGYQEEEREGLAPKLFITYQGTNPTISYPITTTQNSIHHDGCATIIYDASKGNANLKNHFGAIYAHTGIITQNSTSQSDWKYDTDWGDNSDKYKLNDLGNNKHQLVIENIREYYNVDPEEQIQKLNFVFRNEDGSITGKDLFGEDLFIDVVPENGDCNTLTISTESKAEISAYNLIIYPNPTNSTITIYNYNHDDTSSIDIKLFSILGQLVYNHKHHFGEAFNISHLPSGNYLVKVNDANGINYETQKLILIK